MVSENSINARGSIILSVCMLATTACSAAYGDSALLEHVFNRQSSWIELASHHCAPSGGCADACVPSHPYRPGAGPSCVSGFCTRETLTGGFGGLQPSLGAKGIIYDAQLTQFGQCVTTGGALQDSAYGGKLDQFLIFDSTTMGLWEGAQVIMHAETRFGDDVILDAAGLAPVNANMLYPTLDNETAITGLLFQQALSEEWAVSIGKFNALDLLNMLYPQTGRGIDGFMNGSLFLPLTTARTFPLSYLGAGLTKLHDGQIQGSLMVYDSNNIPTTSGLSDLFDNGANILAFWRFFTEIGGLPGSHGVLGSWASGDFTSLDPTGWEFDPVVGLAVAEQSTSWSIQYFLEQTLWADAQNPERNVGLLSQWGYSDPETCPYEWVANVSVQGQGLIPGREQDRIGVGYFYNGLSHDFQNLVDPIVPIGDLWGAELYYNAAITPWFRVTGDVQFVRPGVRANDTAVVLGLRACLHL